MSKDQLREGLLDTALKGILGLWFGGKLLDRYSRAKAFKDPAVKKQIRAVQDTIAEFDAIMAQYAKKKNS